MANGKPAWSVFKTSPGRIDPRTGRLVQVVSTPVGTEREAPTPVSRREGPSRRPWERGEAFYPQPRPEYAGMLGGSLGQGENKSVLETLLPWVVVAGVALIAIEVSGITRPSPQKGA